MKKMFRGVVGVLSLALCSCTTASLVLLVPPLTTSSLHHDIKVLENSLREEAWTEDNFLAEGVGPLNLLFQSQAMYSTWVYDHADRLLFDAGEGVALALGSRCFAIERIFLSHGHIDP